MRTAEEIVSGLIQWCEDQREFMSHQIVVMRSGKMHFGSVDSGKFIDESNIWITETELRISELDHLLSALADLNPEDDQP